MSCRGFLPRTESIAAMLSCDETSACFRRFMSRWNSAARSLRSSLETPESDEPQDCSSPSTRPPSEVLGCRARRDSISAGDAFVAAPAMRQDSDGLSFIQPFF